MAPPGPLLALSALVNTTPHFFPCVRLLSLKLHLEGRGGEREREGAICTHYIGIQTHQDISPKNSRKNPHLAARELNLALVFENKKQTGIISVSLKTPTLIGSKWTSWQLLPCSANSSWLTVSCSTINEYLSLSITKTLRIHTRYTRWFHPVSLVSQMEGARENFRTRTDCGQWSNVGGLARSGDCRWCGIRPGCAVHSSQNRLYNWPDYSRFIPYILLSRSSRNVMILRPTANSTLIYQGYLRLQYYSVGWYCISR